jgi:hypothetical protein
MSPAPLETAERIHALIALYRHTHYSVVLPGAHKATIFVGDAPTHAIADWIGADADAAYLTACNPYSQPLSEAQNNERLARLRERLLNERVRFLEGSASIPGEVWFEPSLLVAGLPLPQIDALAREFEQNAIVLVARAACARLRLYRSDWFKAVGSAPHLDWANG